MRRDKHVDDLLGAMEARVSTSVAWMKRSRIRGPGSESTAYPGFRLTAYFRATVLPATFGGRREKVVFRPTCSIKADDVGDVVEVKTGI